MTGKPQFDLTDTTDLYTAVHAYINDMYMSVGEPDCYWDQETLDRMKALREKLSACIAQGPGSLVLG